MKNFWKNKKVFITGYEGFLGSWLTKTLLTKGAKIIGLDILTNRKKTVLSKNELSQLKIIKGDVKRFQLVKKIIKNNKIEIIFHLAAKSLVGDCLRHPLKTLSTNIQGTWNILEASSNLPFVKAIIIASSDKAYGDQKILPYRENSPLQGINPYDASKSCADLLANMYFHTYSLPVCVTRCGNIFGPGDFHFSRIVPDTIRSIAKEKKLFIRSNGKFIRDYIYIKDIIDAYLTLAKKMVLNKKLLGEPFNFSNENPLSVLQIVKLIYKLTNNKPNFQIRDNANYEIKKQYLCSEKAKKLLKWQPKYNLEDALNKTIQWYLTYYRR